MLSLVFFRFPNPTTYLISHPRKQRRPKLAALCLFLIYSSLATCYAADQVRIAFGNSLIPYSIEKTSNGIELDIIREALRRQGYTLVPVFVSFAQKDDELNEKKVDGVATINQHSGITAFYSEPYITYSNVAITLKSRKLSISGVKDLKGLKIAAFQDAPRYLGESFQRLAENNPLYREEAQQINQNRQLYNGAVDVIIADQKIFRYLDQQLSAGSFPERPLPVVFHAIFSSNPYQVGFRDASLRDKFNAGLASLSEQDLQEIYARYRYQLHNPPKLMP